MCISASTAHFTITTYIKNVVGHVSVNNVAALKKRKPGICVYHYQNICHFSALFLANLHGHLSQERAYFGGWANFANKNGDLFFGHENTENNASGASRDTTTKMVISKKKNKNRCFVCLIVSFSDFVVPKVMFFSVCTSTNTTKTVFSCFAHPENWVHSCAFAAPFSPLGCFSRCLRFQEEHGRTGVSWGSDSFPC